MARKVNHKNTKCNICGANKSGLKYIDFNGNPVYCWYSELYNNGEWTGKYICESCHGKKKYRNGETNANLIKEMSDHRTNNLDPNSSQAKGDKFEELTSKWRGIKMLSKELDNYRLPYDHSRDSELGIIETKGRLYDPIDDNWDATIFNSHIKEFDYLIFYCANKDGKVIERIYIFPIAEIIERGCVAIYRNPSKGLWYEKYRIIDEEIIKKINEIWKEIII